MDIKMKLSRFAAAIICLLLLLTINLAAAQDADPHKADREQLLALLSMVEAAHQQQRSRRHQGTHSS